jgi:hypothetical protein
MAQSYNETLDSAAAIPGYYDSPWPAECGGPRRQKAPRSRGLAVTPESEVKQTTRVNDEWNVMMVLRKPGEVFMMGNNHIDSKEKYGFLERIDPVTLETLARSPNLDTGGHTWCGGVVVHENGYLYLNNGNRCFKLDADCNVLAERVLPQDSAYNSFLIMADGSLVMKNMEHQHDGISKFVVLEPDSLEQVGEEVAIPENSMGRIAMDTTPEGQFIYVPGRDTFFRFRYEAGVLTMDESWQPIYRTGPYEEQTFSWDSCIAGGGCYFLDNGDNEAMTAIFSTRPFGQRVPDRGAPFRGLASSPQKLFRIDLQDAKNIDHIAPFGSPRGNIFSPPAFDPVRNIGLAFDTGNGHFGAVRYTEQGGFEKLWSRDLRISMQMVLFIDTGEIVVNDFQNGYDDLVVFDIESGAEKARVSTGSQTANGMFLSTGWNRDVYYCSTSSIARMYVE